MITSSFAQHSVDCSSSGSAAAAGGTPKLPLGGDMSPIARKLERPRWFWQRGITERVAGTPSAF